jgi:hypothetical protein
VKICIFVTVVDKKKPTNSCRRFYKLMSHKNNKMWVETSAHFDNAKEEEEEEKINCLLRAGVVAKR